MSDYRRQVIFEADLMVRVARRRALEGKPLLVDRIDANLRRARWLYLKAGMSGMAAVVARYGRRLVRLRQQLWPQLSATFGELAVKKLLRCKVPHE